LQASIMWQHTVSIESASVNLAADRGGVEPPHAILDLAGADQSETVDREREHLDIDRSHLTRERKRVRRFRLRRIRVVVGERELGAQQ